MMVETLEKEESKCPFADLARHCPHQETYTRDIVSAMKGDMVFICTLERGKDCPYLREYTEE
jgi:hypothetical protein